MSETPWVSVIMPTYNGRPYLDDALQSIALNTRDGVEIIAVDDGSTDGTLDDLRRWSAGLPLQVISRPRTGNWVAGANIGLAAARGRYLCFLHQDDRWEADRLERLHALTMAYPEAAFLVHAAWFIDKKGQRVGRWTCPFQSGHLLSPEESLPHLAVQNFIAMPAPLFSRAAVERVGPMDESLWFTADWVYWGKLMAEGSTLYDSGTLASFRIHPFSQTARGTRGSDALRFQYTTATQSILTALEGKGIAVAQTRRVAAMANEISVWLAACAHREPRPWGPLLGAMIRLRPWDWGVFFRDSRICERVRARLRAGLWRHRPPT